MKKVFISSAIAPAAMELLEGHVESLILSDNSVETARQMVRIFEGLRDNS